MKKLIALMMALAILTSFAACGSEETTDTTVPDTTVPATTESAVTDTTEAIVEGDSTAVEVLDHIWVGMGAEHQPVTYGGHMSEEYTGGPYTYDLTYAEDLAALLLLPEDQMNQVVDAATVVHLMNANTLTSGVIKLGENADVAAFAKAASERISGNQWICGFPEKMAIIQINGDMLFIAFGNGEMVDRMVDGMGDNWEITELYNQPLV